MKDRQYGNSLDQIRKDHTERYFFAAKHIPNGSKVLDLACGCGYGSWIIQNSCNAEVTAVDIELEAIQWGQLNFSGPTYLCQSAQETFGSYDVLVSFETLEHLDDPMQVLRIETPLVIASVPNQERMMFDPSAYSADKYPHKRHYTPRQFDELLEGAGLTIVKRCSQGNRKSPVEEGTNGISLVYVCKR